MRWRRLDVPGHEQARARHTPTGWEMTGSLHVEEGNGTFDLHYRIEVDRHWCTRTALVYGVASEKPFRFDIVAAEGGGWTQNGVRHLDVAGAVDIDLGFTPATNTLPIRRLGLAVGEVAPVRSAWLRFPELRLEPLDQTYTREAEQRYRYRALVDGEPFTAVLETDAFGRVLEYEGLWEAEFADPAG